MNEDGSVDLVIQNDQLSIKCPNCNDLLTSRNPPIKPIFIDGTEIYDISCKSLSYITIRDYRPKCPCCGVKFNITINYT